MGSTGKTNLYNLTKDELAAFVKEVGQPAYRATQLWTWMYKKLAGDFASMTNLPKVFRAALEERARLGGMQPVAAIASSDGHTRKWLLEMPDRERIEAVLMEYDVRDTACISVQVGCAYACAFCATGRMGLVRNLAAGEIVEQIVRIERELRAGGEPPAEGAGEDDHRLTNIVFMGMGEPLSNYREMTRAIRVRSDPDGLSIGARRMTLSTVGLVPAIRRLADEPFQVNLAVSLHAPTDDLRDELIPINRQYPIATLMDALREYFARTGRRLTFEYAMINEVNDRPEQAELTARLLQSLNGPVHVNLIPLNPVPGSPWPGSERARVQAFAEVLREHGIPATVRMRRGIDVAAGCGQLYAAVEGRGRSIVPLPEYPTAERVFTAAAEERARLN
ncbi:MAG TPA: 23S rRNA (adenine(2503)-C(2))-methyltransferase RlmN [Ardenticatenaceae bacterium]|nr:23S rRNA (adenine(2503)-C(2))-methyltransferase RlmN [Ardenticatenaceae bacterium]